MDGHSHCIITVGRCSFSQLPPGQDLDPELILGTLCVKPEHTLDETAIYWQAQRTHIHTWGILCRQSTSWNVFGGRRRSEIPVGTHAGIPRTCETPHRQQPAKTITNDMFYIIYSLCYYLDLSYSVRLPLYLPFMDSQRPYQTSFMFHLSQYVITGYG